MNHNKRSLMVVVFVVATIVLTALSFQRQSPSTATTATTPAFYTDSPPAVTSLSQLDKDPVASIPQQQHPVDVTPVLPSASSSSALHVPVAAAVSDTQRRSGTPRCRLTWAQSAHNRPLWTLDRNENAHKGCPPRQRIQCEGERLPKALVIYMLHTRDNAHDMHPEMFNFKYFQDYAVFGPGESTELFSGVDYIFTRMVPRNLPGVAAPTLCAESGNVKLVWLPGGPCDLCAHHRIIQWLGGVAAVAAKYSYIVYLNAATRGPFQHAEDPAWIDVFAMGGQAEWTPSSTPIMTGPTISRDGVGIHVQSYMVGLPIKILHIADRYLDKCHGSKSDCIYGGEVPVGDELHRLGAGWLHTLARNTTLKSWEESRVYGELHKSKYPRGNPIETDIDACAAVFVKHGGTFLRAVPESVASQLGQLTTLQSPKRRLSGHHTIASMLAAAEGRCPFLAM